MARNSERDAIYTVSIPKDSELLKMLLMDARETNISIAKLIALRVSDWYKVHRVPLLSSNNTIHEKQQTHQEEPKPLDEEQRAQLNASVALDEWL